MDNHSNNRAGSQDVAARTFQISLKSSLVILTLVAVILGGAPELYRLSVRTQRRKLAEIQLQLARENYNLLTSQLRRKIAADPANATEYESQLRQADADMKEVERILNDRKK
jgi:hypothetical protein